MGAGTSRGVTGEISEVRRSGGMLYLYWRIPGFLDLPCGDYDFYDSPPFDFYNAQWHLRVYPNCCAKGRVDVSLCKAEDGPGPCSTRTVVASVGRRRGSGGGAEWRSEKEQKFEKGESWDLGAHCNRSDLSEQKDRLMPGDELTIECEIKKPGTTFRGELTSGVLFTYSYKELQTVTQNFGDLSLQDGGCKIGEGLFGTVFRAVIKDDVLVVKRLKDPVDKQFMTELMTLTIYKHRNLLPLIGFSLCPTDERQCCLLSEYMQNGSLQDRLACADGSEPLSWQTRLSISHGTALGIHHLHTFGERPMVHRDIKSANILLDKYFVPKLGDFGLVGTGSSGGSTTLSVTDRCIGTRVYMPREAFMGDVSVKWDTFSFGVILLELLTGLPPLDPNREDRDLVTHMEVCKDILPRLDPRADWKREAATELYGIARRRCLVQSWRSRSTISEILEDLRELSLLR